LLESGKSCVVANDERYEIEEKIVERFGSLSETKLCSKDYMTDIIRAKAGEGKTVL